MAAEFPTTVREFWRLLSNKSALVRLAKHYSVVGWERWQRSSLYDTDATLYAEIEDAVNAYPSKCLRSLAMTWGLQYSALKRLGRLQHDKRLGGPLQQEGRLGKRKADTDNGSRRVKAREGQDSDSASQAESTSSQDINDQQSPQDVDDQRSQLSRVILVQVQVPSHLEGRYGDLMEQIMEMAAAEERGHQEYREPSEHTRLRWKVGSSTPSKQWVPWIRVMGQSSAHNSELQGRHRERSPREELNQPAPSTVPFGLSTREELQLHQPVSMEEPN